MAPKSFNSADYQDPSMGSIPGVFLGTSFFLTITKDGNEVNPFEIGLH